MPITHSNATWKDVRPVSGRRWRRLGGDDRTPAEIARAALLQERQRLVRNRGVMILLHDWEAVSRLDHAIQDLDRQINSTLIDLSDTP